MDDDEYYDHITTLAKVRTLDDVANDVRSNLNKTIEGIIGAGKALLEGRDLHPSYQVFGNWCDNEFPELHRNTRYSKPRQGTKRYRTTLTTLIYLKMLNRS